MIKEFKTNYLYSAFNGSEVEVFIDNIAFGEIQKVEYDTIKKEIKLNLAIFNSMVDTNEYFINMNNSNILYVFQNEYGDKMYRLFNNVTYVGEKGQQSVDEMYFTTNYIFSFESATPYTKFECSVQELSEQIFNSK